MYIEDVNLSGQTLSSAWKLVDKKVKDFCADRKIVLVHENNIWAFDFGDISLEYTTGDSLRAAYRIGRMGSIPERLFQIASVSLKRAEIPIYMRYDRSGAERMLLDLKKQIDREPQTASVKYEKGNVVISRETVGKTLDIDKNLKLLENHIVERDFKNIPLEVDEVKPGLTYEDIRYINSEISSFSTVFNPSDENRSHNIRLACGKISGTVLMPGDEFSMDRALGPRTIENGYLEAPVIYKNELIKGPGGGICQVTTTLYDAVLKAMLTVVERTHHSLPLGYVQPGQDATISEQDIDFKFRNDADHPVCINAEVAGNRITVRILGKKDESGVTVKLRSETREVIAPGADEIVADESVPYGEKVVAREAKSGIRAALYRETFDGSGNLIKSEKISEDTYQAVNAKIKVNPAFLDIDSSSGPNAGGE